MSQEMDANWINIIFRWNWPTDPNLWDTQVLNQPTTQNTKLPTNQLPKLSNQPTKQLPTNNFLYTEPTTTPTLWSEILVSTGGESDHESLLVDEKDTSGVRSKTWAKMTQNEQVGYLIVTVDRS